MINGILQFILSLAILIAPFWPVLLFAGLLTIIRVGMISPPIKRGEKLPWNIIKPFLIHLGLTGFLWGCGASLDQISRSPILESLVYFLIYPPSFTVALIAATILGLEVTEKRKPRNQE